MREILFRGKRVDDGEWVFGHFYETRGNGKNVFRIYEGLNHKHHTIIPETVGQYTGVIGKNGKKIFEGDVIQTRLKGMNFERTFRFVIKHGAYIPQAYCKKEYAELETIGFYALSLSDKKHFQISNYPNLCEVVGNIHDNPELLGGGEDG